MDVWGLYFFFFYISKLHGLPKYKRRIIWSLIYTVWTKRDQTKQHCVYNNQENPPEYLQYFLFMLTTVRAIE